MEKTCVKCGYTQNIESICAQSECPKCGVIYAKAETMARPKDQEEKQEVREQKDRLELESHSSRRSSIVNFLVLGCIACIFLYLLFGRKPVEKIEEIAVVQVADHKNEQKPIRSVQADSMSDDMDPVQPEIEEDTDPVRIEKRDSAGPVWTEKKQEAVETMENNHPVTVERPPVIAKKIVPVNSYLAESTISRGNEVILDEYMSDRRFTVFYFYADW